MGMRCEFDLINDFGYPDILEDSDYGVLVEVDYSEGNDEFCRAFLQEIRLHTPVDTGYLLSTIDVDFDDTYCECWTDCEYAEYVEYGTIYQTAQPYFEPAILYALNMAKPIWDNILDEAIDALENEIEELAEEEEEEVMATAMAGSGDAGFFGNIIAILLMAIIMAFISFIGMVLKDLLNPREEFGSRSRSHGSYDEGSVLVYMPEIEIY